jgi:hypothetical protein
MAPPGQAVVADRTVFHSAPVPADVPVKFPPARVDASAGADAPAGADTPAGPLPPVSALEAQFRAAQGKEARIDLAGQIADWNDAGAIEALGRLFTFERHPEVKLALITDLNDIDPQSAPESRLALLSTALRDQPRNIRAAALDSLANIEDPRAESILKQAMSNDPDYELRQQAAALYRALHGQEP